MVSADQQTLIQLYSAKLKTVAHDIDAHAMQIIKRLKDAKFEAYLVGGGVRDLLVSMKPKDFDIATSASPNEVRKKVPYSFIIGRRFKLVHAKRGEQIYEIATFRRAATTEELQTTEEEDRRLVEENFFGNIEEDSFRRDFTINSLYYDPIDHVIVDHCNGLSDIYSRTLRMIGNPKERLSEDPIRILRAIRLSQKLNFTIEQSLRTEILNSKNELKRAVLPRCREEWIKFFRLKNTDLALMELFDLSVFEILIPTFHKMFSDEKQKEDFLCYIRNLKHLDFDLSDPVELFSGILTAYLKAVRPDASFNIPQLSENETFLVFCRDELGVFKAELAIVFQALHFINLLKKIDAYMKKGDRRQRSVVFHTTFLLTVKLGLLSGELSQYEYTFWMNEREKYMLAEKQN